MSKYKAIIFDFDNTLVDSATPFINYTKEFLKNTPYSNYTVRQFSKEIMTPTGTSENISRETTDKFWSGRRKMGFSGIKPYPEDRNGLEILHKLGINMGILSRSTREKIDNILERNGLRKMFSAILGSAEKPDPTYLVDIINQMGVEKEEVLYVGDDAEDIETGKEANVATVFILRSDPHSQESYQLRKRWLEKNKPNYLIHNLMELVDIVKATK